MSIQGISMETVRVGRMGLGGYLASVWRYRHLMFHLASSDLQSRFRRSSLGVLWAMVHPLMFALLYALVLANIFKQDFRAVSVYVFAGFVLWDALSSFVMQGAQSIVTGSGYLKQAPIPMVIFPVRTCLTVFAIFLLGFLAFFFYRASVILLFHQDEPILTIYWLWVVPIFALTFLFGAALSTIVAFINLKFRDMQQILQILVQALWFSSPVFFPREAFDTPALQVWATVNPVVAFLDAFRDATIHGRAPEAQDWIVMGLWIVGAWLVAIVVTAQNDRKCIHYV
jgi:lipopolysaccharide transport system permease protein